MRRATALLLTLLTGFTGLVYEVTWQKYLATLLGSHSEATSAVLAIFLGGLSVGYALFGRISRRALERARAADRPARLLLAYGLVEAAIGVYALAFPWLFRAVQGASHSFSLGPGLGGFASDVLLSALLIGPPTILMGSTIPLLTQSLSRGLEDATRLHAWVYALNTAGALGGALAGGFLLIPALGLDGVMRAMSVLNLAAGAIYAGLGIRSDAREAAVEDDGTARGKLTGVSGLYTIAFLIGFAMMAIQTVLIRIGGLSFGASETVFSMVVAGFVACIAVGSGLVSWAGARARPWHLLANACALVTLLALLYTRLDEAPYWAHVLRTGFPNSEDAFAAYYASGFAALLAAIGPAVICSGAMLPLLFHCLRDRFGDLGAVAGQLYAWSTVGSLVGALLGGYALLFWLDLDEIFRVALAALALAAGGAALQLGRRPTLGAAIAVPFLLLALLLPDWSRDLLASGLFRVRQPLASTPRGAEATARERLAGASITFYADGPASSVAVREARDSEGSLVRSILNNGKSDGSTGDDFPTTSLLAIVPGLLADETRTAFVIGYGTGVSAGSLTRFPDLQKVVVAEISHGVLQAAPLFDFANHDSSESPRVELVRGDAYRTLLRRDERYDVIVSEPSNPWGAGIEMLFSREFLSAARSRLNPGGVYVQWYHQYETNDRSVAIVLRTFASVFDTVGIWYGVGPDLLLLGTNDSRGEIDLERLERRAALPGIRAELARAGIRNLEALLAHELWPLGVLKAVPLDVPVHSLFHPILSHEAGRGFFRGSPGLLPFAGAGEPARIGRQQSLLARLARSRGGSLGDEAWFRAAGEACRHRTDLCMALLTEWGRQEPESSRRAAIAARVSEQKPWFGGKPRPDALPQLDALASPDPASSQAAAPALAERASRLFFAFSQPAAPLPSASLFELWERCSAPAGGDACTSRARRDRARVEALGGSVRGD